MIPVSNDLFFPDLAGKTMKMRANLLTCGLVAAMRLGMTAGLAQIPAYTATGDTILISAEGVLTERRPSVDAGKARNLRSMDISNRTGTVRDTFEEGRRPRPLQSSGVFPTNPIPYTRPAGATLFLHAPNGDYRVWFDPQQWVPQPPDASNPKAQMIFAMREAQALAMVIHEPTEVPLPALVEATVQNLESIADNVRLVAQEFRDVNDRFVLCVRIDGSLQDQTFTYYNYYYQGEGFTVQFTLYAPREVFLRRQGTIRSLMNGLVVR